MKPAACLLLVAAALTPQPCTGATITAPHAVHVNYTPPIIAADTRDSGWPDLAGLDLEPVPAAVATTGTKPNTPAGPLEPTAAQWAELRRCENSGRYTSAPGDYYRGAYQFDGPTWSSVGGHGDPADASPAEQDARALTLWLRRGWQPWPTCGPKAAAA